ncbi:bifunctional 4-hydroxy-2-oxoglutarate aldolase/2-dehydro-3-deoxy-phosphogluconate aldolase [Agreia sp. COWG]|uniref:bifunctional 4-hydroxy-2-oxoglutarate aldolase/2-dehydro-3-deoxy-phosphogluconate aldolase n=1 Tax=Agreia sp. COWG TaxID=2773266 RepID=UPI001AF3E99B|nr:bifunctional 4-hydroxy-2-oxoglutarate aldolase/2-dehydro-3-deoxy-phosphogluconate aldolase [Agreia sp. COWG]CAD6010681.1 4-hydroxy-2-oxoglutarate aldolase / 2-dehydro-3-deoxy-phosphogluconate aldolase [Agreia sp. COWG]
MRRTAPQTVTAHELGGVVPVIVIDDADRAPDLARALMAGGISCAEVTLRTPAALAAIASMARVPGFLVGAGTVRSVVDIDAVIQAGARFAVTPGISRGVLDGAAAEGLLVVPGASTATDLMNALDAGVRHVKIFPAEALGGPPTISLLSGPFPEIQFLPSGGLTAKNAPDYSRLDCVFAVSGSWMAPRDLLAAGRFDEITALSAHAVRDLVG